MAGCNTGRNIQKYKGGGASTLQDALENGNTASLNINLSSPAVFVGDGGGLSNISASATTGNLQSVTDNGATTTNKITFSNTVTSLETSGNVVITGNVTASNFLGDGGTLSNIAANKNFQEVTDIGASTSNKITLTNSATSLQTTGKIVSLTLEANVNASNIVTADGRGINQLNASNVSIGTLAIARGGTGADTASAAASALGLGVEDQPSFVTVNANVNASNVVTNDGSGINQLNASNVSIGEIPITRGGTGATSASAAATALGVGTGDKPSFVTVNANVNASNVVSTDIYGTIRGSNTISSSTVNAITLNANVNASNIVTSDGRGINQLNASNVNTGTLIIARGGTGATTAPDAATALGVGVGDQPSFVTVNANVNASNIVTNDGRGINQLNASNVSIGTLAIARGGTGADSASAAASALGLGVEDQPSFVTVNANVNASNVVSTDIYGTIQGSNTVTAITLNGNVNAGNVVTNDGSGINQLNASNVNVGKLAVNRGGTNLTSFAKGDIIIASDTNELDNLNLGSGGHVLTANSSTSLPEWRSAGEIGATVETHSNGSYILGGAFTGADPVTWSIQASTSNLSDYIVVRDSSGDINVSNINAIEYYGDGGTLSNIVGSQDLQAVIDQDPYTSSAAYFGGGLYGEIKGSNVINASTISSTDLYGEIKGSNAINASTLSSLELYGEIKGSNVINASTISSTDLYGEIKGSNTVTAITLNANVNAGNVVSTDIYGTIQGSNTVTAITLTGNVNAGNVVTNDGRGIDQLNASNINTGNVLIARGGTGLEAVAENELLLGPSSGTALTKLPPYTADSTKKFLRSNNSGVAWDDVSSATIVTTNEESSTDDHGLIFVANAGTGAQALLKDSNGTSFGTLKYKPSTGTLTTSNLITSGTSQFNGIANTTPTHTLSVGTVVSIHESASGDVFIVRKGDGYFSENVYIAKKLTIPVGGEILADTIKCRSFSQKGTTVVAERLVDGVMLGSL